jgi:hypothetical protein
MIPSALNVIEHLLVMNLMNLQGKHNTNNKVYNILTYIGDCAGLDLRLICDETWRIDDSKQGICQCCQWFWGSVDIQLTRHSHADMNVQ